MTDAMSKLPRLEGRVAVVTGASRGIGKGIALALGDAGATVYVTGRTLDAQPGAPLPGTVLETARAVDARGGRGVAVRCDHDDDDAVRALVERVTEEQGRLDLLVNNAFGLPAVANPFVPFWELPLSAWDTMHRVGLRCHYVATALFAPLLMATKGALVACISSFGGAGYQVNVPYGVGKAAVDRLARDLAHDLRPHGVTSVSLWPGIVRTERILKLGDRLPWDMRITESPELTGRAVVALAGDADRMRHTGEVLVVAELALAYGFTDIDGSTPASLRRSKGGAS